MEKVERRGSSQIGGGDSKPLFKLLLTCPSGLSQSQVSVVCDESYDRIPHPDINLEKSISEIWEQRVERSPSLFNGSKFRYAGHNFHNEVGSDQVPHLYLHLGLTDYRMIWRVWQLKCLAATEEDFLFTS